MRMELGALEGDVCAASGERREVAGRVKVIGYGCG